MVDSIEDVQTKMTPSIEDVRASIPIATEWIYLNHGQMGPIPKEVTQTISKRLSDIQRNGFIPLNHSRSIWRRISSVLGREYGAKSTSNVVFSPDFEDMTSKLVRHFVRRSQNILVVAPNPDQDRHWLGCEERGLDIRRLNQAASGSLKTQCEELIDGNTALVVASAVNPKSGSPTDIADIAALKDEKRKFKLLVEASLGVGWLPMRIGEGGVDILTFDCNHWLLGLPGLRVVISDLIADRTSSHRQSPMNSTLIGDPDIAEKSLYRFSSSLDIPALSLYGSLTFLGRFGFEDAKNRILALSAQIRSGLREIGWTVEEGAEPSAIVAAEHPSIDAETIRDHLFARNIQVGVVAGKLWFAPHIYNLEEEIDTLLRVLDEMGDGEEAIT